MPIPDSSHHRSSERHYDWFVIVLLGAVAIGCAWVYRDFAQDDAFITYRYARNIANGRGFVYNPGEPVLGTTTPLYTVLLASLSWLSQLDIRLISHLVSILSLWVAGVTLYYVGKPYGAFLAAAVALTFVSNAFLITSVGMETLFLLALMLLALKSYMEQKLYLTGLLLGLLILTRYETVLFAGLLGAHFLVRRRKLPLWLLVAMLLLVPWLIFAWSKFGQIIPHSAVAKLAENAVGHGYPFAVGAILWWRIYVAHSPAYFLLLPLVLLGAYSALRNKLQNQPYMLLLAWSVIYFVAASLVAGSFPWYYGPLIPGLSILLVWGAEFLVRFLGTLLGVSPSLRTRVHDMQVGSLGIITLGIVALQLSSWTNPWVLTQGRVQDGRDVYLRQVAAWLRQNATEHDSLAAEEIGILGYYVDMRIVDLLGLVSPELQPFLEHSRAETLTRAIEIYVPGYVLACNPDLLRLLRASDRYEPVQTYRDRECILYTRY
jgi:4-amino-4-deoxy-L-arabinose transferase-like glycosyltransferase